MSFTDPGLQHIESGGGELRRDDRRRPLCGRLHEVVQELLVAGDEPVVDEVIDCQRDGRPVLRPALNP